MALAEHLQRKDYMVSQEAESCLVHTQEFITTLLLQELPSKGIPLMT